MVINNVSKCIFVELFKNRLIYVLCVGLFDLSILISEAKNVGASTEIHLCVNRVYVYLSV